MEEKIFIWIQKITITTLVMQMIPQIIQINQFDHSQAKIQKVQLKVQMFLIYIMMYKISNNNITMIKILIVNNGKMKFSMQIDKISLLNK